MSEQFEQDDREALVRLVIEHDPGDMHPDDQTLCVCGDVIGTRNFPVVERDPYGHLIDKILAAGFRRTPAPQQVSTVEELGALPVNSVLRGERMAGDLRHFIAERIHNFRDPDALWSIDGQHYYTHEVAFNVICPATVLYRPEGGESNE